MTKGEDTKRSILDAGLKMAAQLSLESVTIGENGITEDDVLVHDEWNRSAASLLAAMRPPEFPMAIGVLYHDPADTYDASLRAQSETVRTQTPAKDLNEMIRRGNTWTVNA